MGECRCCDARIPFGIPRNCPICGHVFQGKGWEGIDAHWRAKHTSLETYEEFFASLCPRHRDVVW
jgi:hypothetical protein